MRNKKNVYILFLVSFLQALVFYYPIATLYRSVNGLTLSQISIIESISFVVTIVLEMPWGYLADRFGYKKVLIAANVFYFVSKLVFYIADDFNLFLIERIFLGIAVAGLSGCDSSLLYLSSNEKSMKVFSWYSLLGTCGLMCASLVYSFFLVEKYRLAALLTSIMYLLSLLLTLFLDDMEEEQREEASSSFPLKGLITNKKIIFFVLGGVLLGETMHQATLFIGQMRLQEVGLLASLLGIVSFLMTLAEFSATLSEKLVKQFGKERLLYLTYSLAALVLVIIGYFDEAWIVACGLVCLSVLSALISPIYAVMTQESVEGNRAQTLSLYSIISSGITIFLNLGYGYLGDWNSKYVYYVSSIVVIIALWNMKTYIRSQQEKQGQAN